MKVIELLPQLHMLSFPVGHAYLWQDPAGLTLIDTSVPGSAPLIVEAIEGRGYQRSDLRRLLLTHFHEDHVGSAADIAAWGEPVVYAHRADAPVIRGEAAGLPPTLADWEQRLLDQVRTQLPPHPSAPVRVDRELDDGDLIGFGSGIQIQAVTSFKRQTHLDAEIACFGHGEPLTANAAAKLKATAERLSA